MQTQAAKAIAATVVVLSFFSMLTLGLAQQKNSISYQLLEKDGENAGYTLNIVVPDALLRYYQEKSHRLSTLDDFTKFVTPYALKPIADCLRQVYQDDEGFVNGALMIVHQMNYLETQLGKYPAETLVDSVGDCDIFSYVAASIVQAGGIEVVLLDYEEKAHMNIGVNLQNPPENAREEVYKFEHDDKDFYIAETTGGNWTRGWRVGECPENMKQASAKILTLENSELVAPGQVSASFKELEDSNLSLEIWPPITLAESTVTVRGSLKPSKAYENVTLYLGVDGYPWAILGTAVTRADGAFEYKWKTDVAGIFAIRASWAGDSTYSGATTEMMNAMVIPIFLGVLVAIALISAIVAVIAILTTRHSRPSTPMPIISQPSTF